MSLFAGCPLWTTALRMSHTGAGPDRISDFFAHDPPEPTDPIHQKLLAGSQARHPISWTSNKRTGSPSRLFWDYELDQTNSPFSGG